PERHLRLVFDALPAHPNGLRFAAFDAMGQELSAETFYSVGGGFVASEAEIVSPVGDVGPPAPHPYSSAADLLALCEREKVSIAELVRRNEAAKRGEAEIEAAL